MGVPSGCSFRAQRCAGTGNVVRDHPGGRTRSWRNEQNHCPIRWAGAYQQQNPIKNTHPMCWNRAISGCCRQTLRNGKKRCPTRGVEARRREISSDAGQVVLGERANSTIGLQTVTDLLFVSLRRVPGGSPAGPKGPPGNLSSGKRVKHSKRPHTPR